MIDEPRTLAVTCAHLADQQKADRIVVLHVGQIAYFTDYFIIATGLNLRHLHAMADELRHRMKALGQTVIGVEGEADSGWVLLDLGSVIVHLFSAETREMYDLEMLWGECPKIDWPAEASAVDLDQTGAPAPDALSASLDDFSLDEPSPEML